VTHSRLRASLPWLPSLLLCASSPLQARTFAEHVFTPPAFNRELAESISRAVPPIATSAPFAYHFDLETGTFVRESLALGQLFLERADTLGQHRFSIALAYQRVALATLDGRDIEKLSDTRFPIVLGGIGVRVPLVSVPLVRIALVVEQEIVNATYGVTENLDINLTLPLLYSRFDTRFVVAALGGPVQEDSFRGSKFGAGDLSFRAKYQLGAFRGANVAAGVAVRAPTGNEENFQGSGDPEVAPGLFVSSHPFRLLRSLEVELYLNAGTNFDAADVNRSEGRWGLGLDCGLGKRFTAGFALLGRHPFSRIARPGFFDVPREDPRTGRRFFAPLLGLSTARPDFYDLAIGGRIDIWRDTIFGFGNVLLPVNGDGVRPEPVPLVGIEVAF